MKIKNLKVKIKNYIVKPASQRAGFTILEALVAISIVLIAIATSFSIAPQGIFAGRHARNQATAYSLAQEALEVVHNKRDNRMYYTLDGWLADLFADAPSGCIDGGVCGVNGPDNIVEECNPNIEELAANDCRVRTIDRDNVLFYGTGAGTQFNFRTVQDATIFYRTVSLVRIPNPTAVAWMDSSPEVSQDQADTIENDIEVEVTARVWWKEGNVDRVVLLRENLFDWYSQKPQ